MAQHLLTIGEAAHQGAPRSFFWARLVAAAGGAEHVADWLIAQANARGFHGAFVQLEVAVDPKLELEDVLVGLLMPHAELDARIIKLVVRVLQSGKVDVPRLAFRARRERADNALAWVVSLIPESEVNDAVRGVAGALRPVRGATPIAFRYDSQRLVKRPATKENLRRAKQR